MRKKLWIKKCLSAGVILMLIACMMLRVSNVLERKESQERKGSFYQYNGQYDVLFYGTSHGMMAISPMQLWEEQGIKSYNLCGYRSRLITSYWIMKNSFLHCVPKVVVIDTFMVSKNDKKTGGSEGTSQQHVSFDIIPLSKEKVSAIFDMTEKGERDQFFWDFLLYHNRWDELEKSDFSTMYEVGKGAETMINIADVSEDSGEEVILDENTLGAKYLRKMIEECQSYGVEVVLTYLPFSRDKEYWGEDKLAEKIAEEYGVPYLGYEALGDVISIETDFSDSGHYNLSGQIKMTQYLGKYLKETFQFEDCKDQTDYNRWQSDYQKYIDQKVYLIQGEQDLENLLMLLNDKNFDFVIKIPQGNNMLKTSIPKNLLIECGANEPFYEKEYDGGIISVNRSTKERVLPDDNLTLNKKDIEVCIWDNRSDEIIAHNLFYASPHAK